MLLSQKLLGFLLGICSFIVVATYLMLPARIRNDSSQVAVWRRHASNSTGPYRLLYNGEFSAEMTENMTQELADITYFRFISHQHYTCEDSIRLGDMVDGGWDICLVPPFQFSSPCLVYSFGINYDFSFDDAVSRAFGCTVRSFDPSMKEAKDHRRDDNIWFYKIGLGGADTVTSEGWTIKTLRSLINMLNDTGRVIDYLKIDIENNEWAALENMFESDVLSNYVKQFGIEIHTMPNGLTNAKTFYSHWKTLRRLEQLGFKRWYWHFNHYGAYQFMDRARSCCYELAYVNTRFLRSRHRVDVFLNKPNAKETKR